MNYQLIRSNRKTMAIEITENASVLVRAPRWVSGDQIERFVTERKSWIDKNVEKMRARKAAIDEQKPLDMAQIDALADRALSVIPERVAHFAPMVGVTYGRITIRNQRTRWGSCSAKGNLNFNCLLMLAPKRVLDYVVVHELCHRKEMNHSKRFWSEVARIIPDYKDCRRWLKTEGDMLISRMR